MLIEYGAHWILSYTRINKQVALMDIHISIRYKQNIEVMSTDPRVVLIVKFRSSYGHEVSNSLWIPRAGKYGKENLFVNLMLKNKVATSVWSMLSINFGSYLFERPRGAWNWLDSQFLISCKRHDKRGFDKCIWLNRDLLKHQPDMTKEYTDWLSDKNLFNAVVKYLTMHLLLMHVSIWFDVVIVSIVIPYTHQNKLYIKRSIQFLAFFV